MLNLAWMVVVGGVIGLVSSMFVSGTRSVGMARTIGLGMLGYAVGGGVALALDAPTLVQWISGIILAAVLLTAYLAFESKRAQSRRTGVEDTTPPTLS